MSLVNNQLIGIFHIGHNEIFFTRLKLIVEKFDHDILSVISSRVFFLYIKVNRYPKRTSDSDRNRICVKTVKLIGQL